MKLQIIFATGNKNKIREIRDIITDPEVTLMSMKDAGIPADPDENGTSFEENAVIKAEAVAALLSKDLHKICEQAGLDPTIPIAVMSDDSGLCVDALDGAPGIYSARYMGHETSYTLKMNAILDELKDVPDEKRGAQFVAAVAAVIPENLDPANQQEGKVKTSTLVVRGVFEGRIAHEILGENGFGYDPFFYLPELGKTSAEITEEEKNELSHRGKAIRAMMAKLEKLA